MKMKNKVKKIAENKVENKAELKEEFIVLDET